jgi:hypothetical protein
MNLQRMVFIILSGIVLVLLSSCDLFSTRSTEPPIDSGTGWIPPTQVDQVFVNMSQAIAELNSDNYLRSFFGPDETENAFLFLPNPNAVGWPASGPWDYNTEERTIEYLFSLMSPDVPGYLQFNVGESLMYGADDSVWVTKPYRLVVPVSDPNQNVPQDVSGTTHFYLAKTSIGYWAVYRWEDVEGSPSWTDLKAWLY